MATSKSPDLWTGGALVYSGRRDPTWPVSPSVVCTLLELWKAMPPASKPRPSFPGLGYRGAFLRAPDDREWIAFNGVVSLRTSAGVEIRRDAAGELEKALLASAPKGALPAQVFRGA